MAEIYIGIPTELFHSILERKLDKEIGEAEEHLEIKADIPKPGELNKHYIELLGLRAALISTTQGDPKEHTLLITKIYNTGYNQALLDIQAQKEPDGQAKQTE